MTRIATIEDDCRILLERALLGKYICAFGEDGFGQYGRCDQAQWYKIKELILSVTPGNTGRHVFTLYIMLDSYSSAEHGHIMTDRNFDIALATFLKAASIDPKALTWPLSLGLQGQDCVALDINLKLLLDGA